MYKVIQTTDRKFVGTYLKALPQAGGVVTIGDYSFTIDKVSGSNSVVKLSNANYVVVLTKES